MRSCRQFILAGIAAASTAWSSPPEAPALPPLERQQFTTGESSQLSQAASSAPLALEHVTIVDVETGRRRRDQTVVVKGNRIAAIWSQGI